MKSIKHGSKSFFFSTLFLPPTYWTKINTLYDICRTADDIVDTASPTLSTDEVKSQLSTYYSSTQVQAFFADNNVPIRYFDDLILGVESDLAKTNYQTFDELYVYCYRVGGTVGIMLSHLFQTTSAEALKYSEYLGVGMQLTNILRDVREDALRGRFYLPSDDMHAFNVSQSELVNGQHSQNFADLINFYITKADFYFDEGNKGIELLPKSTRFGIQVASDVYRQILRKIEQNNYNVLESRIYTTKAEKLKIALGAAF